MNDASVAAPNPPYEHEVETKMNRHTRSPQHTHPRSHLRAVGFWILALLAALAAMSPHRAWATNSCLPAMSYVDITASPITYSGTRDGMIAGTAFTPGAWQYTGSFPTLFGGGDCSYNRLTGVKSTQAEATGVLYNDNGTDYQVFKTNVPGIGYIVSVNPNNSGWRGIISETYASITDYYATPRTSGSVAVRMKFVAYGQLASGIYTLAQQNVYTIMASSGGAAFPGGAHQSEGIRVLRLAGGATITITARGCEVTSPTSQTVSLPPVAHSAFTGVGSTPGGASPNFNFNLACDPNVTVEAVMTDASDGTNTSNRLRLATGSTAAGVGVQIFRDGGSTPLSFGPDSSSPVGTTNQWHVGYSPAGPVGSLFPLAFRAGYVQTDSTVTPGHVKAAATITFSYH